MLNIPILRSARFTVQLQEISILNAIKLANMSDLFKEQQTTYLLQSIIENVSGVETNPLLWTVQERMFVVGHYIATSQDESPDFTIGDNATYSDYLQGEKSYHLDQYVIGEYEEDIWTAIPLLGIMVETIEALEGEIEGISGRVHWQLGCMACQLYPNDQVLDVNSSEYDKLVLERMLVLSQMPESAFIYLMAQLSVANDEFCHLFATVITENGIAVKPTDGGANKPYARFPAHTAITSLSKNLCGKP